MEKVFVEAYHVENYVLIPKVHSLPPLYYLGRSEETNQSGEFKITFPDDAYGIIGSGPIPGIFKYPNIHLKITDQYRILYEVQVRLIVTEFNNYFDVKIPSNFVYSNEITHVDYDQLIKEFLEEMSGLPKEEVASLLPGLMQPIINSRYTRANVQAALNYRGINVPETPKKQEHEHTIPWYGTWKE